MALSDTAIRNAKLGEKQKKISDGGGLYLLVLPSGGRVWRLAYRFDGKQKALALGRYPAVSLADARAKRDAAKTALSGGEDPAVRPVVADDRTFEAIALRWHETNRNEWVPEHSERVLSRMKRDVFPEIGSKQITEVEAPDVLALLRKVEDRGALDISKRLRQSIGAVFRFAIAEGKARSNPAADVGDALKPKPKVQHFASLKADEIPDLVQRIGQYDGEDQTRLALMLTLHTFLRTKEIRHAEWCEFNGDLWRVPAVRMKMGREHLVPLSRQSLEILEQIRALNGKGRYLFPGARGRGVMSQNTMIFGLYRMGYHSKLTVHGFRSMASTVLNEQGWNRDWIEKQLSHDQDDEVRAAYNAAEYLKGRRDMMQWWSDFIERPASRSSP